MRKNAQKALSIALSLSMTFSLMAFDGMSNRNIAKADDRNVTSFKYDFAYSTPGYADGTIYVNANEDGVYKVFWGDEKGEKLTKDGNDYSELARVVVKDGVGSFNIVNDYTAIPEGAKTVLLFKKDSLEYTYDIPAEKQFVASENKYTFGSISDPHFTRYSTVADDDAVPAMDKAMDFLDNAGVKFVAMSGDLTNEGEQTALDRFNAALDKHPDMTVVTAIGNHDSRTTLKTSDTSVLDTSITRWYKSITSSYYTVENGQVKVNDNFKAKGYDILDTDALINPIDTQYREAAGGDGIDTTVPGLDFVTEAGNNIFIFFNDIAKTGETYDTDKLVTTGQMDWLQQQLEKYKDSGKNVFLYQHYYLAVNTLDNDSVDYNFSTGDLKNAGGYSYDLDYKDDVTTTDGNNLQQLLSKYSNATLVSGHSHWQYSLQSLNSNLNFGRLANGNGATMIHLSSVTEPRYIASDDTARTSLNGYASEGATVTTYDDCTVYNNIDFANEKYEAYATYISPKSGEDKYQPVKNEDYKESETAITGEEYLDADDLTEIQLLKSDYNLLKGAGYKYYSKGSENTDAALTDGLTTGGYYNSKQGAKTDQRVTVETEGVQDVSNLKAFMLYFVNGLTDSKKFNIQLSLDGEEFETVYESPEDYNYLTRELKVDTSNVKLTQYKYVRINLLDGPKNYGYQIREFAAIGYEKNKTPNTANGECGPEEGLPVDESDKLNTDYNLVYAADYTQTSVGNQNNEGSLTDGSISNNQFINTERSNDAKDQTIIIDIGRGKSQDVSNISHLLLYNQNDVTNASDFEVSISLDGENYETIGKYENQEYDKEHYDVDLSNVTLEKFRYVKLHITNGNTNYGYQIKEFAIIGKEPVSYPSVKDQTDTVSSSEKNLALGKTVFVSTTAINEGTDPTVLTDGNTDKYWSSLWDATRTSEYVVIDLGEEVAASLLGRVLVNFVNDRTFCKNYSVEVSKTFDEKNPNDGFVEMGRTKAISWDILQKYADPNGYVATDLYDAPEGNIRYVKIKMNGHADYGFQIKEIAVIQKTDIAKATVDVSLDDELKAVVDAKYNGTALDQGSDYTVEQKSTDEGIEVTVTGLGNYGGYVTKLIKTEDVKLVEAQNVKAEATDINTLKVSFEGSKLPEKFAQTYDIYLDDKLVGKNKEPGEYTFENVNAGKVAVKVVAKRGEKSSEGVAEEVTVVGKDITKASLAIADIAVIYNGNEQKVPVSVIADDKQLVEGTDYELVFEDNVNAGTAKVIVNGIGLYEGKLEGEFTIAQANIEDDIVKKDLSNLAESYEYKVAEIQPQIKMSQGDVYLSAMKDYEIVYSDNMNPGAVTMTIKGIGNYTGTIEKTFVITKRKLANTTIKTSFDANKQLNVLVQVPDNGRALTKDKDYKYTVATDATGNITITITGIGENCEGTVVKTIAAKDNPNRPTEKPTTTKIKVAKVSPKAKNVKGKKIKLSWKKIKGVKGYQVRYALSKGKLKKAKIKAAKKNSYVIKKLKNKKYFVQVRAYKVVGKKKYYGAWSKVKSVKVKK